MLERLVAALIIGFVRLLTGAQAFWRSGRPNAAQRIFFANHASHGDFVLLWASLPTWLRRRTRPVAGADYWNKSQLRRFIGGRVFRAVLIDRERKTSPSAAVSPDPIEQMVAALAGGDSLILFPEGTRNTTDAVLLPFKSGLFHLATQYPRAELVPVWINNLARVMPKGQLLPSSSSRLPRSSCTTSSLARARAAMLALRPDMHDDDAPDNTATSELPESN